MWPVLWQLMCGYIVLAFLGFCLILLLLDRIGARADPDSTGVQVSVHFILFLVEICNCKPSDDMLWPPLFYCKFKKNKNSACWYLNCGNQCGFLIHWYPSSYKRNWCWFCNFIWLWAVPGNTCLILNGVENWWITSCSHGATVSVTCICCKLRSSGQVPPMKCCTKYLLLNSETLQMQCSSHLDITCKHFIQSFL